MRYESNSKIAGWRGRGERGSGMFHCNICTLIETTLEIVFVLFCTAGQMISSRIIVVLFGLLAVAQIVVSSKKG